MANVADHYRGLLSEVYSWMLGGFAAGIARNEAFFAGHGIAPRGSGVAIDLGAGCGFQSIPLARLGFRVTAIDTDQALLDELDSHRGEACVRTVADDLMQFERHLQAPAELIVCMTDTLLHLDSPAQVASLFAKVAAALEPGGRFIATVRDLSTPLTGLDRFIPVQSDASTILSCFLEDAGERVRVHDLLYRRRNGSWTFAKSFYYKLRLKPDWLREQLGAAGFGALELAVNSGLVTIVAARAP